MSIKVAINGFGRIGRLALRQIEKAQSIEVVAVNDLTPADMLLHLFKYDSTQGRFEGSAELKDDAIVVNGKEIKVFANPNPEELPWGELGVDVVLECTGFFTNKTKAEAHIRAGARKVVISAPGGNDVKTVVYGVNQDILDGSETVISAASCTTNCLAPMAAVLQKEFGIVEGLMTTIHAYTGDQNTLDAPHRKGDFRRARAAVFERERAAALCRHRCAAVAATGLAAQHMGGGAREKHHVARAQPPRLVVGIRFEPALAARDDMYQPLPAPRLVPHIPFALKQTLHIDAAAHLRERHQLVENIHFAPPHDTICRL